MRRPARGTARLQRFSLLVGLFAAVTLGFALAPYVSIAAVGLLVIRSCMEMRARFFLAFATAVQVITEVFVADAKLDECPYKEVSSNLGLHRVRRCASQW